MPTESECQLEGRETRRDVSCVAYVSTGDVGMLVKSHLSRFVMANYILSSHMHVCVGWRGVHAYTVCLRSLTSRTMSLYPLHLVIASPCNLIAHFLIDSIIFLLFLLTCALFWGRHVIFNSLQVCSSIFGFYSGQHITWLEVLFSRCCWSWFEANVGVSQPFIHCSCFCWGFLVRFAWAQVSSYFFHLSRRGTVLKLSIAQSQLCAARTLRQAANENKAVAFLV